jgi:transposase
VSSSSRDVVSDEVWELIGPLFPPTKPTGRPPVDRRTVVEAVVWRYRTGAPWRDLPERFGNWNTIYRNFNRWAHDGVWARLLEHVQGLAHARGDLDWAASINSTIARVHQHGATLPRVKKRGRANYNKSSPEPPDHAIGRSRGGLTTKTHLVCDGKGRPLGFVLTGGQVADTVMLPATMDQIRVPTAGRPRTRPERIRADKGYPSKANRAWLRQRHQDDDPGTRRPDRSPAQTEGSSDCVRPRGLQGPQRCRTVLQPAQAVARDRDAVRQDRPELSRCPLPGMHSLVGR